ncbi:MAG: glycosyltransferase family 1 protein [Bacteroidales bacterium]
MNIAVNTRLLLKDKLEGIGWFTYETLRRIVKEHPEHKFIFIFDRPYSSSFIFSDNVKAVVVGPQARHPFLYPLWFEWSIPRILKKYQADIFLSPDGYISLSTKTPTVDVIHDLNFEHNPKDLPFLSRHYYRYFFPRYAKKAAHIITVSHFSAQDISSQYAIPKEKISVAWNGVNPDFAPAEQTTKQHIRQLLTQGHPYLIFVGALHPRKNIINILTAFDHYKALHRDDPLKLLIVGEKMWRNAGIQKTFEQISAKDDVIFSGRMNSSELKDAYGAAEALVFASYFEGFGIPILEAFKCHTPVITSNVTSMPEVAGEAALLIDPNNHIDISQAIKKIREDTTLKEALIKAGSQRVQQFSWDNTAALVWEGIEKVIRDQSL